MGKKLVALLVGLVLAAVAGELLLRVPQPWLGSPPRDLVELGIADPDSTADEERWGRVRTPSDARGFPNVEALERAR